MIFGTCEEQHSPREWEKDLGDNKLTKQYTYIGTVLLLKSSSLTLAKLDTIYSWVKYDWSLFKYPPPPFFHWKDVN